MAQGRFEIDSMCRSVNIPLYRPITGISFGIMIAPEISCKYLGTMMYLSCELQCFTIRRSSRPIDGLRTPLNAGWGTRSVLRRAGFAFFGIFNVSLPPSVAHQAP